MTAAIRGVVEAGIRVHNHFSAEDVERRILLSLINLIFLFATLMSDMVAFCILELMLET